MNRFMLLAALVACSSSARPVSAPVEPEPTAAAVPPATGPVESPPEKMTADTQRASVAGNGFIAPAEWTVRVRGQGTLVEAPEAGSVVAIYDLPSAKDAADAVTQAWTAYKGKVPYPLLQATDIPDDSGWTKLKNFAYDVPPATRRLALAQALFANNIWTVILVDVEIAVAEKRGSQFAKMFTKFVPKGGVKESFAGKTAHTLDKARIDELVKFIDDGAKLSQTPGIALGLIQNGKVVYSGGVGVRQLGKPGKVDGNTKFIVASNTKALSTLMLAKLVDQKKITWDTAATALLPSFKLGNAETTSKVAVKHLICACTGMPRQDYEWFFEFSSLTPAKLMESLGAMQPTSNFGELFQYSNPLAAAAGFIGGHVANPKLELGAAYDKAMQELVFGPLKMSSTTFDFKKGKAGNAAIPHGLDLDGKAALALAKMNDSVIPVRPAGGAWSTVNDMLKYVQMELAEGMANGKPYIGKDALLARRAPQVAVSGTASYGMGLVVDTDAGTTVVNHGGDLFGFHSDMIWLPEHGVGAVILTNGDGGGSVRSAFKRKLLEVLFDGKPEADIMVAAAAKNLQEGVALARKLLTVPADGSALAARYRSDVLGTVTVKKEGGKVIFDAGEFAAEVASRKTPDGTVTFTSITPGVPGVEFVAGEKNGKRTLTARDGQHDYVLVETD